MQHRSCLSSWRSAGCDKRRCCGLTVGLTDSRTALHACLFLLPCSKRFRARWMAKRLLMLTGSLGLMLFVTEQYIQPTIDNSLRPLRAMVRRYPAPHPAALQLLQSSPGFPAPACASSPPLALPPFPLRPLPSSTHTQDWLRMVERILKLSLPTLYWWLAMFYTLFDLWLNVLAELLRFGDREFYKVGWWVAWLR